MKKLNRKTYLIEHYDNGKGGMTEERRNKGFHPMVLLGILERIQLEIINQLEHQRKPDVKKVYVGKRKVDPKMLEAK